MKALTGTERVGRKKKGGKELNVFQQLLVFVFESGSTPDCMEGRLQILKLKDLKLPLGRYWQVLRESGIFFIVYYQLCGEALQVMVIVACAGAWSGQSRSLWSRPPSSSPTQRRCSPSLRSCAVPTSGASTTSLCCPPPSHMGEWRTPASPSLPPLFSQGTR
jgi:hypothetical protein